MDREGRGGLPVLERLEPDRLQVRLPALDYGAVLGPRRRGEVAMVIERCPGWVLLQTKHHYPPGVFRLPTGTVRPRESVEAAMLRELHEEANLVPGGHRRLGRVDYLIEGGRRDFFSEIFLIQAPLGELHPNDLREAIGAWREAPIADLALVAQELRGLEPPWTGWGLFRSVIHQAVMELVSASPVTGP